MFDWGERTYVDCVCVCGAEHVTLCLTVVDAC
jgi:hypothetical protein